MPDGITVSRVCVAQYLHESVEWSLYVLSLRQFIVHTLAWISYCSEGSSLTLASSHGPLIVFLNRCIEQSAYGTKNAVTQNHNTFARAL